MSTFDFWPSYMVWLQSQGLTTAQVMQLRCKDTKDGVVFWGPLAEEGATFASHFYRERDLSVSVSRKGDKIHVRTTAG